MKFNLIYIICFVSTFSFAQNVKNDSIFVLYEGNNEIIKMKTSETSKVSGFTILRNRYNTKQKREKRLKYLREHGGGDPNFYIGFTGEKNFILNRSIKNLKLSPVEDISKEKLKMKYGQKVFFIEKLDYNKYKFHQTYLGYN